jgi:hypothetical protein
LCSFFKIKTRGCFKNGHFNEFLDKWQKHDGNFGNEKVSLVLRLMTKERITEKGE